MLDGISDFSLRNIFKGVLAHPGSTFFLCRFFTMEAPFVKRAITAIDAKPARLPALRRSLGYRPNDSGNRGSYFWPITAGGLWVKFSADGNRLVTLTTWRIRGRERRSPVKRFFLDDSAPFRHNLLTGHYPNALSENHRGMDRRFMDRSLPFWLARAQ